MGEMASLWTSEKLREVLARDSNDARAWALQRTGIEEKVSQRELFEAARRTRRGWGDFEAPYGAASPLRAPIDPALLPSLEEEFERSEGRHRDEVALAGVLAGARGELLAHVCDHTHDLFDFDRASRAFGLPSQAFSLSPEQQRELDAPHPVFEAAALLRARPEEITAERIARVGDQILPCIAHKFGLLPAAPTAVLVTLAELGELSGLSEEWLVALWEEPEDVVLDWGFLLMEAIEQWPLPALAAPAQMAWLEALEDRLFGGEVEERLDMIAMQALYVRAWLCYKADAEEALAHHEDDPVASVRARYRFALDTPEPLRAEPLEKLQRACESLDAALVVTALADELIQIWQEGLRGLNGEVLFECDFYDEISEGGMIASRILPVSSHARFLAAVNEGSIMPMGVEAVATFALMEEEANFREVCEEVVSSGDPYQRECFLFLLEVFAPTWAHEVLEGKLVDWMRRTTWTESCHHIAGLGDARIFDEFLSLWTPGDRALGAALRTFAAVIGREQDIACVREHDEGANASPGRMEHHMCGACGLYYGARVTHCWVYEEDDEPTGLEFVPIPTCPHCDSVGSWEVEGYEQRRYISSAFGYLYHHEPYRRADVGAFETPEPGELSYMFLTRELSDVGHWERPLELIEELRGKIEASPTKPQYYFHLGRFLSFLLNFEEAVEHLEHGLKLQPQNIAGWYHLCRCYMALGDSAKTRDAAWRLIERSHTSRNTLERANYSAVAVDNFLDGSPQDALGLELVADTRALARAGMIPLPAVARVRVRDVEWAVLYELIESGYLGKITRCPEPTSSDPTWAELFRRVAQADVWDDGGTQETFQHDTPKVGRNDPCPCGSGKKYKKCCLRK